MYDALYMAIIGIKSLLVLSQTCQQTVTKRKKPTCCDFRNGISWDAYGITLANRRKQGKTPGERKWGIAEDKQNFE